jgi:hypothetical protein
LRCLGYHIIEKQKSENQTRRETQPRRRWSEKSGRDGKVVAKRRVTMINYAQIVREVRIAVSTKGKPEVEVE